MKKGIVLIFFLFNLQTACCQVKLNYGFGFNLNWEPVWKHGYLNSFRIGVSGGCGAYLGKHFMPYLQYTQNFYQGGLGSSLSSSQRYKIIVESLFAKGFVVGSVGKTDRPFNKPIYTMGFFNPTPLYTDFTGWYFNVVSTSVFRLNKSDLGHKFRQHVGGLGIGITRYFDGHYYNDGAFPIDFLGIGDNKDRFWTGGGFFNIYIKNKADKDLLERNVGNGFKYTESVNNQVVRRIIFGFDRFTGYNNEGFEVAKKLKLNFMPYKDVRQSYYNRGRLFGGLEFAGVKGASLLFSWNDNDRVDVQHIIHNSKGQTFHGTLHKTTLSANLYYSANQLNFPGR